MKTKFVRFQTDDRLILQGLLYEPDQKTDNVILHIHGMAGNFYENKFLDSMAKVFTDNGLAFFCPNTRGHDYIADFPTTYGKFKRIGNTYEIFEESVFDVKAAIDWLETSDFKTIILQGHSLGSPKVAYYIAASRDKRISKLVLASPADMVGLAEASSDYKNDLETAEKYIQAGKPRNILPNPIFPEDSWEGYLLSAQTYISLSKRGLPVDIINTYDKGSSSLLNKIEIPILAFFGGKDNAIIYPPKEVLEIIKNKATKCPSFDTDIIGEAPHSYAGYEDEVANKIIKWVTKGLRNRR